MTTQSRPNAPSPADEMARLLGLTSASARMQKLDYRRRSIQFAFARGWRWALAHSVPWLIAATYMAAVYAWQTRARGRLRKREKRRKRGRARGRRSPSAHPLSADSVRCRASRLSVIVALEHVSFLGRVGTVAWVMGQMPTGVTRIPLRQEAHHELEPSEPGVGAGGAPVLMEMDGVSLLTEQCCAAASASALAAGTRLFPAPSCRDRSMPCASRTRITISLTGSRSLSSAPRDADWACACSAGRIGRCRGWP